MKSFLKLKSERQTDSPQLWIVGCSFSHGTGVTPDERYGQLIANELNSPVSFLTEPGSSVGWAADQILRSDIKKDDIVIWGLTGSARFPFLDDTDKFHHINRHSFNRTNDVKHYFKENILISNHMIYESITSIEQVHNFLNKISAKFILAIMPCNIPYHDIKIYEYVSNLDFAIVLYDIHNYTFLDKGSDNNHPGILHHKWYASELLKFFNSR